MKRCRAMLVQFSQGSARNHKNLMTLFNVTGPVITRRLSRDATLLTINHREPSMITKLA